MFASHARAIPNAVINSGPARRWRWAQRWYPVLFAHWRVPPDALRKHLPADVELDTWDGAAWVSVVAFRLNVRLRGLPQVGPFSDFLEMNLRTYVRFRGESAVHFFSLLGGSRIAVRMARWLTPLPYSFARITHATEDGGSCHRLDATRSDGVPLLRAEFRPSDAPCEMVRESLDWWLLERYRAVVPDHRGRLFRMAVQHPPWQVSTAKCRVTAAGLGDSSGLNLNRPPDRCHFSEGVEALLWPFENVSKP